MIPRRFVGAYCIVVGMAMVSIWVLLYLDGEIPQLVTAPLEIGYHLVAEGLTAGMLLITGYGIFRSRLWSHTLLAIASGLLLYTVINSAGYYASRGEMPMVGMFTLLTILTGGIILDSLRESNRIGDLDIHRNGRTL